MKIKTIYASQLKLNTSFVYNYNNRTTKGIRPNMINTLDLNSINELSYTAY